MKRLAIVRTTSTPSAIFRWCASVCGISVSAVAFESEVVIPDCPVDRAHISFRRARRATNAHHDGFRFGVRLKIQSHRLPIALASRNGRRGGECFSVRIEDFDDGRVQAFQIISADETLKLILSRRLDDDALSDIVVEGKRRCRSETETQTALPAVMCERVERGLSLRHRFALPAEPTRARFGHIRFKTALDELSV